MTNIKFYQVDAFTDTAFKGNPAAVCLLEEAIPDELLQQIAFENNLAETAYLVPENHGYNLRWFTPTVEVKLCGHATVASAHILWENNLLPQSGKASFYTKSGELTVTKHGEWIRLNFPKFGISKATVPDEMIAALGCTPVNTVVSSDGRFIIELADESEVRSLTPDYGVLKNHEVAVVTSKAAASSPYDFISRSFTASLGVDEDWVTGSSHCCLAPYWSDKLGKLQLSAFQASARGGALRLEVAGDRVLIEGKAVTVIEGVFRLNN